MDSLINKIKNLIIAVDRVSVYDIKTYSIIELYYDIAKKLNDVIEHCNNLSINVSDALLELKDILDNVVTDNISKETKKLLTKWVEDGTLVDILNDELLTFLTDQIDGVTNIRLKSDIDGTDYKQGDVVDFEYIKTQQIKLYSSIMRKMRLENSIKILCRGDSLTYGFDITSDNIISASETPTDLGREHSRTRAPMTYPQALNIYLNSMGINATVENIGYSGAWVEFSYQHYYLNRSGYLEIIQLGTNDSRLDNCPYKGDVERFVDDYEQLIIREILMGNALILVEPIQIRQTYDEDVDSFRRPIRLLAQKYNIPLINGDEMLNNYSYDIWSDNTHLNSKGYEILGYRMGATILNKDITQPQIIKSNSILLMSPIQDSVRYRGDSIFYTSTSGWSPDSIDVDRVCARLNNGGELHYTFYNTEENLVVLPNVYMYENATLNMQLNLGVEQAKVENTWAFRTGNDKILLGNVNWKNDTGENHTFAKPNIDYFFNDQLMIIPNIGWHTLTLKNTGEAAINLFGIEFLSIEDFLNVNDGSTANLYVNSEGISSGNIELGDNISNYSKLVVHSYFAGNISNIVDLQVFNNQEIRVVNIDNDSNQVYCGEMVLEKTDDTNISITKNVGVRISDGEVLESPFSIRMITGIK